MSTKTTAKKGIVNAVNLIRSESSQAYQDAVPMVTTRSLIQEIANPIMNYDVFKNEFISGLVNRIALTKISNMVYDNPLSIFKKGSVPLGTDIQDIFTNPAVAERYEMNDVAMQKLLTVTDPDTKVAYYRRNRQDLYTVTISNEQLTGAFVSWEALEDLIASITNSLYSGNYIDEFKYTKGLISGAVDNNKVIMTKVNVPTDETSGKAFVKTARNLYSKFKFPSSNYNAYSKLGGTGNPVITWTTPDRVALIIRSDILTEIDVDVLAAAFNIDSAKLMGRIYEVDQFDNPNVLGVICDESFLQIYDNNFKFTEFYNARTMTWNYYLHAWGTYAISPFANAVALVTELPANPTTAIDIISDDLTITKTVPKTFEFAVIPPDTTYTVTAGTVSNVTTEISGNNITVTVADDYTDPTVTIPLTSGSITQNLVLTVNS